MIKQLLADLMTVGKKLLRNTDEKVGTGTMNEPIH
jgi:hypothetical protein